MSFSLVHMSPGRGLSADLLAKTFAALPPGSKLVGIREDFNMLQAHLFFESEKFKETPDGTVPPSITPWFSKSMDPQGNVSGQFDKLDMSEALDHAQECFHVWKEYHGAMHRFNYCEKCNKKENE